MGLRRRTENEVRAYVDGYNACFKQFTECLKKQSREVAVKQMEIFVKAVTSINYKYEDEENEQ